MDHSDLHEKPLLALRPLEPPLLRLPAEIIARIFLCYAEVEDEYHHHEAYTEKRFALERKIHSNMSVCTAWRDVIQQAPQLWTSLVLSKPKSAKRIHCYKENSGDVPLHIYLKLDGMKSLAPLWTKAVRPLIHRWATIDLAVTGYDFCPSTESPPLDLLKIIRHDLENASQLTCLYIFNIDLDPNDLEPEDGVCASTPINLPNLLSLRVNWVRMPIFKAPSLRRLVAVDSWSISGKYIWMLLASASELESIDFLELTKQINSPEASWRPDPNELSLGKLKHFASKFPGWDGNKQLQEVILLTTASLRSLKLHIDDSDDICAHLQPGMFVYLTDLDLDFPFGTLPTHILQLMKWMKQAPSLGTVSFSFRYADAREGLPELALGSLLINPDDSRCNVISPLLSNLTLEYTAVLPSLLLEMIAQREAFRECRGEVYNSPGGSRPTPFLITLENFVCHEPLLRDGMPRSNAPIDVGPSGLSEIREALAEKIEDIGAGDFDAFALSKISDPEERLRALCSLLNLELEI